MNCIPIHMFGGVYTQKVKKLEFKKKKLLYYLYLWYLKYKV